MRRPSAPNTATPGRPVHGRPDPTPPILGLLFAGLVLVGLGACGGGSSSPTAAAQVAFTGADGRRTTIADIDGPVVVNMWATWCQPCVREMPAFDAVAATTSGVTIIGVNIFDEPDEARSFATDRGVQYSQFTDPNGELSTALAVTGYPATAFFDDDGTLLELHQGELTEQELRSSLRRLYPDTIQGSAP